VWIVRWILIASVIILILGLALQNDDLVELSFFTWNTGEIPVYMVIYLSFAAGMIVFLLLSIFHSVQQSFTIGKQKRTIRKLEAELDNFRTAAADEKESLAESSGGDDKESSKGTTTPPE